MPTAPSDEMNWLLLPAPRQFKLTGVSQGRLAGSPRVVGKCSDRLSALVEEAARPLLSDEGDAAVSVAVSPAQVPHPQGYKLTLDARGKYRIRIVAADDAGVFYAAQTLKQLGRLAAINGAAPLCRISDWPDFPNRGVMLDIARCKLPEMKTLYELVDLLASWKYNQLQMYSEHAFAFRNHRAVWLDASPMTPEQICDLDAYCRDRFIELVPNQNSFGHMNRWLMHPQYAHLAETQDKWAICPVDPGSIDLLRDIYDDLLPCFSSSMVNVGCDETWDLGKGRSKQACDERGLGRVYLEFLLQIHELVASRGKTMQFWGDIIHHHPELIPQLPKDVVAMEWGYEADHDFANRAKAFKDNGVRFYVVPGTSSWNSFLGRTRNALANLESAARNGIEQGAEGFLNTDWGDGGHWQFLPVSYLPFAYGAAVSWCHAANHSIDIKRACDLYAFCDQAGVMGEFAYDIGNVYTQTSVSICNNSPLFVLMQHSLERPLGDQIWVGGREDSLAPLQVDDLQAMETSIHECLSRLELTRMTRSDADLIKAEFRLNGAMAVFACHLGVKRVKNGGVRTSELPGDVRRRLAAELEPLLTRYCRLWMARNRSGGLKESVGLMESVLEALKRP